MTTTIGIISVGDLIFIHVFFSWSADVMESNTFVYLHFYFNFLIFLFFFVCFVLSTCMEYTHIFFINSCVRQNVKYSWFLFDIALQISKMISQVPLLRALCYLLLMSGLLK